VPGASGVALVAHDYDAPGKPLIAWDDDLAKASLIDGLVRDALALLDACEGSDPDDSTALGLLALVAGQDVELDYDHWRIVRGVAPERVISIVDPESRHMHKSRSEYRDGYKAHLAVEPTTGLVTAAALTPANAPDGSTGVELLANEGPLQVLADAAYGSGEVLAALAGAGHSLAIKPYPSRVAIPGGFDRDDFVVDESAGTVSCPAGHVVPISPLRHVTFGSRCAGCPLRARCTKSARGRSMRLTPNNDELIESRRAWREGDFKEDYRTFRPMVERSIAWLVADHHRRVRFRGVEKNQLGLSLRVAAINLRRLINLGLIHDGGWALATT
jgi:IS5 family transposase